MPLKAYVGLPRAGKSYEVVVNVILPGLRQGRRVVSNIAGLNYEAMCQVLYQEGVPQEQIGRLVSVDHSEVEKPSFWRTDTDQQNEIESFIQPGDLVALDEIWRFWKKRGEINPRSMNFMRMHGHMTHPKTGLTCEIALITQSVKDINENIREVVQETYQMIKNTKLGSDKSYIVHVFQRGSTSKADFIRTLPPRFYKPEHFPLYKSHSQHKDGDAAAQEKNPDARGNILHGALFKIGFPLALILICSGFYFVWKFLHPAALQQQNKTTSSNPAPNGAGSVTSAQPINKDVEVNWRVVGYYYAEGNLIFLVQNATSQLRLLTNPPNYQLAGISSSVELPEGGFATSWAAIEKMKGAITP